MSLLIKNGEIVTASERYVADILCENETITRIDRGITPPTGAEVIDAKGKFVFPGFIDPHVHIYLPFMGTFSKDDYVTGSQAALVGGTTTLIEMCCPARTDDALEELRTLDEPGRRQVRVRLLVSHGRDEVRRQVREATPRDREARHQLVQNLPRLQRRVRRGRHGTLSHAQAGEGTRRHRHRALRERNAGRRALQGIDRRRQDRSGVPRTSRPVQSRPRACIT